MALKYMVGDMKVLGPPYTKAEEADFYSRLAHGPVTMYAPSLAKPNPAAPPPASKPTAKRRRRDR
jgi:hypothetical protein